jgi:hypothetical protein
LAYVPFGTEKPLKTFLGEHKKVPSGTFYKGGIGDQKRKDPQEYRGHGRDPSCQSMEWTFIVRAVGS